MRQCLGLKGRPRLFAVVSLLDQHPSPRCTLDISRTERFILGGVFPGLSGKSFQSLQNISGWRSAVASETDLCETDGPATIDDECSGIRRFLRRIPTQLIRIREHVIGISGDTTVRRQRSTRQELPGVLLHRVGRTGIDPHAARPNRLKRWRVAEKVGELARAEWALISRPTPQEHQHDRSMRQLARERDAPVVEIQQGERRSLFPRASAPLRSRLPAKSGETAGSAARTTAALKSRANATCFRDRNML